MKNREAKYRILANKPKQKIFNLVVNSNACGNGFIFHGNWATPHCESWFLSAQITFILFGKSSSSLFRSLRHSFDHRLIIGCDPYHKAYCNVTSCCCCCLSTLGHNVLVLFCLNELSTSVQQSGTFYADCHAVVNVLENILDKWFHHTLDCEENPMHHIWLKTSHYFYFLMNVTRIVWNFVRKW